MLLTGGILLGFFSLSILGYKYIPLLLQRYSHIQSNRMDKMVKQIGNPLFVLRQKQKFYFIFIVIPLISAAIGFILTRNPLGGIAGFIIGLLPPPIIINSMISDRYRKFQHQFTDAMMIISSSLKAGLNLSQAFDIVAEEMPPPISEEFALVVKENKMGLTLEDCLIHLKQRMPLDDLGMVVTSVSIAQDTGGDLTEIFDQLVVTVTEKQKLENKVKSLTVQGRLQGVIMGVLPIAFAGFVYFTNPHNFDAMFQYQIGKILLVWAFLSEIIGVVLIKKLSKVEV